MSPCVRRPFKNLQSQKAINFAQQMRQSLYYSFQFFLLLCCMRVELGRYANWLNSNAIKSQPAIPWIIIIKLISGLDLHAYVLNRFKLEIFFELSPCHSWRARFVWVEAPNILAQWVIDVRTFSRTRFILLKFEHGFPTHSISVSSIYEKIRYSYNQHQFGGKIDFI